MSAGVLSHSLLCLARWPDCTFLRELEALGCSATILTIKRGYPDIKPHRVCLMPNEWDIEEYSRTIVALSKEHHFDRLIALELDTLVKLAAQLRERFGIPGMDVAQTDNFYDKFVMRRAASGAGIRVPKFTLLADREQVKELVNGVCAPWILKPRIGQGSIGTRKIRREEQLMQILQEMDGQARTAYLVEQFIPGDVFHVDSIVADRHVVFSEVHQYGRPPLETVQERSLFTTSTVARDSADAKALSALNERVLHELGMTNGVTHAEFIKQRDTGELYFLEVAARRGGSFISEMIEAATGVDLAREWARVEIASLRGNEYRLPPTKKDFGGVAFCLTVAPRVDMSSFSGPGVLACVSWTHCAGLIFKAEKHHTLLRLLKSYGDQMSARFLAGGLTGQG